MHWHIRHIVRTKEKEPLNRIQQNCISESVGLLSPSSASFLDTRGSEPVPGRASDLVPGRSTVDLVVHEATEVEGLELSYPSSVPQVQVPVQVTSPLEDQPPRVDVEPSEGFTSFSLVG